MVILLSAFANTRIDDDISRHLGLNRQGARIIEGLFHPAPASFDVGTVIALMLAFLGTMGVAASVQGIYETVFGQRHITGTRKWLRCLIWVAAPCGPLF